MCVTIVNNLLLSLLFLMDGAGDTSELFSTINTVLGLLDKFEKKQCSGVEVAFHKNGKYYDKSKGPNWWMNYFEPLKVGQGSVEKVHNYQKRILSLTTQFEMDPQRAHELFEKYIRIKPEILEKVPHLGKTVGVYYHKSNETSLQPITPYEDVLKAITSHLDDEMRVFVVTSDDKFIKFLEGQIPGKVVTYTDSKKGKYIDGEKELIQALVLSQSEVLIRTSNTFSKSISQLNPTLRTLDLDKNWQEKE